MQPEQKRGSGEMIAAMLISGTIGWLVLSSGQPSANVVFWRCLIGAITLFIACLSMGLLRRGMITWRKALIAAAGGVAVVVNWLMLFAAYPRASISITTAVYNVQPFILVLLGAIFLGERLSLRKMGWLALAFAGMLLLVLAKPQTSGQGDYLQGIALALGAAFFYALAAMATKHLKGTSPYIIILIQLLVGLVIFLPLMDFSLQPTASQWRSLLILGVVHTGLMFMLLYSAIQRLPTTMIGALSFIYPVVAVLVDWWVFDHKLALPQFIGAATILLAAAGMTLLGDKRRPVLTNVSETDAKP